MPDRAGADPPGDAPACNDQRPQPFLVRGNYVYRESLPVEERRARALVHREAIRYRTERYGRAFVRPARMDATPAIMLAEHTTLMGMPLAVNREDRPRRPLRRARDPRDVQGHVQAPVPLGLPRRQHVPRGRGSNHLYGIAIDVDPEHNVCCKCVGPAAMHPICARQGTTLADRMAMPSCWVAAFERFGFYWLGRDELEDTMHFEFLGDPDRSCAPGAEGNERFFTGRFHAGTQVLRAVRGPRRCRRRDRL